MKDLLMVLDGKAVDDCEDFGEVLPVSLCDVEKIVDHGNKLSIGQWRVVEDCAVGYNEFVSSKTM